MKISIFSKRYKNALASGHARATLAALGLVLAGLLILPSQPASAAGIKMAPLEYKTNLNGQIKKGAVDITNASGSPQHITMQVRAFKQVNNKGTLQFYDDPLVSAGVTPDYNQFTLKPDETIHLYFQLNGRKLPKKQVFAALLAQAEPVKSNYNITPILRVGTLLILKNGNGDPPKQGKISNWKVGLFQLGSDITGSFNFKNTETGDNASGYFPNFTAGIGAAGQKFSGDLVFPGIERQQKFDIPGSRIGVYDLKLTSDTKAGAEQWVVVLTGYWRWLLPIILVAIIVVVTLLVKLLRSISRRQKRAKR